MNDTQRWELHGLLDQYLEGLISFAELVEVLAQVQKHLETPTEAN